MARKPPFGSTPHPDDISSRMQHAHDSRGRETAMKHPGIDPAVIHGRPEELTRRNAGGRAAQPLSPPSNYRPLGPAGAGGTMLEKTPTRRTPGRNRNLD